MGDHGYADTGPSALVDRAVAVEDLESAERWDLIGQLHRRIDREAFDAALAAARSLDLRRRLVGVDVLGQIGHSAGRPYREDTLPVVIAAAAEAIESRVIQAAVAALGHLGDARSAAAVMRHATHPDPDVRLTVAFALPAVADPAAADTEVLRTLIGLTRDGDPDVRDWATFGLGSQLDSDTPEIRGALIARLDDLDGDIADEALLGLARRRDGRILRQLIAWLQRRPGNLIVEAAAELAAPQALPALLKLKADHWGDNGSEVALLDKAIAACGHLEPPGWEGPG